MYFDEPDLQIIKSSSKGLNITNTISTIFVVFFLLIYTLIPIAEMANLAASSIN